MSKFNKDDQTNPMIKTAWVAFSIDRNSPVPVFEQICKSVRAQTASGELAAGTRMPPTRVFATELGVSRSTIVTAYEQLVAEGYLKSLRGSGYTVCEMGPVELATQAASVHRSVPVSEASVPRPFEAGLPDMRLFPHSQWAKTVSRVCRTNPKRMLIGETGPGNIDLRRAVADHVAEWRGIEAGPHQIMITAGAGDALEQCFRALADPEDRVGLEDPGYPPLRHYAAAAGLKPHYMTVDRDGAILDSDATGARLIVLTPSHQFPLGGAMSPSRRLDFIHWAEQNNCWIVEDDYDSEFRYAGRPIPAMAGFNRLSRTIYIGSFSKIFSNSLHLGYLIVPETLIDRFAATARQFGVKASYMPQQPLADFIASGEFYRHLRRMRRIYAERRKYLMDRLAGDWRRYGSFHDHQAGMQIAFHLDRSLHDIRVGDAAELAGLSAAPLSRYCHDRSDLNGLLLGFCAFTQDEISKALSPLEKILRSM
ncbi:MAG: PLP-dependent aminotransferase family protein [Alphaproteobacteria bacterium]|nr:PLP-dependent aminotransferase family protein [Alphaproteobacteria bacterium]